MDERPWPAIGDRLADELDTARQRIEELAVILCLDPVTFERHGHTLQHFDHLAQIISEVAGVLRSTAPTTDAISAIGLEMLRARLTG